MIKHFLIIGGSSGIGHACVKQLLEEGSEVTVISREKHMLEPHPLLKHLFHDILKEPLPSIELPLDGMVYLPGSLTLKPFLSLKKEDFMRDFEINVLGAFNAIHTYFPLLKEHSSIVLMSSIAATKGFSFHASIAAAKAAVEGMTKSIAAEFAPKIRVNAIAPSLTKTPLSASLLTHPDKISSLAKKHPLQAIGEPEDLSSMICFLLSNKAKWISGQVFHIDGGYSTLS